METKTIRVNEIYVDAAAAGVHAGGRRGGSRDDTEASGSVGWDCVGAELCVQYDPIDVRNDR